ncbi:MAG: ComEC/Rec2 family competence protein [Marivivens sp.]|nr:ComEC/Rec2 family competence protein [Marivivens sp.]
MGRWAERLERQRGRLLLWAPVCLAFGIGIYFRLLREPDVVVWGVIAGGAVALLLLDRAMPSPWGLLPRAVALVLAGMLLAGIRAQTVAAPVLDFRFYGPVEGRIVAIDRSASDAVRLTLDRVILGDMPFADTPERVRLSLHGRQGFIVPEPGMVVIATAHLSPPAGPVEPGGYDFRRAAWFDRLGAVGYTRRPVLMLYPPEEGTGLWIARLRAHLSKAIRAGMPDGTGAFAAAILTGDRAAIPKVDTEALRRSNLAHLLAISGLHMGLLTGGVFVLARRLMVGLSLVTGWPMGGALAIRRAAAVAALIAGGAYLLLSGGNVATERAFVMVAILFGAVLVGARAITLRAVAVAALVVLVRRPEEMLGPGFQMSFAATVALVAGFERGRALFARTARCPVLLRWISGVVASSLIAGLATAPVALAHFNMSAQYGLLANVLAVPLMGTVVMPGAIFAAMAVAALWWAGTERPPVLVADTGGLIGWLGPEGRVLSKPQGDGFSADVWLENDGAPVAQEVAAAKAGFVREGRRVTLDLPNGARVVLVTGKRALAELGGGCAGADVLIANTEDPRAMRPCDRYDAVRLRQTGALAISPLQGGLDVVTARARAGRRLWHPAREPDQ